MAEVRERFGLGVVVDLEKGSRGIFDVHVDGKRVFSKHELHRFPEAGEIVGIVAAASEPTG